MRHALLAAGLALAAASAPAQGQQRCQLVDDASKNTRISAYKLPSGQYNSFYGGGLTLRCPARGITLVADSAEIYGDEDRYFMLGNVRYRETGKMTVNADFMTYFGIDERIVAAGSVVATALPGGSTLRGPQAEYRRASARVRPVAELSSIGRPTVTLRQQPPPNATAAQRERAQQPTDVTANVLFMRGDSLLYASGAVVISRPELEATGDSAFMNTGSQYMRIMRTPVIEGRKGRPFRLTGDVIDLFSRERQLDRVLSMGSAKAVSEDLTLTADTIDLRVRNDLLQAAYAWSKGSRAEAVSPTQRITADSIAVAMPQQRVERLSALGRAYAEATPDTIRFVTTDKDWLRGDTIFARFDTTRIAGPDSAQARIRELTAIGDARSYQHLPAADSSERRPAIHYVRGDTIFVTFDSSRVRTVRVTGREESASGVYIEPADTTGARRVPQGNQEPAPAAGRRPPNPSPTPRPTPTTPPAGPPAAVPAEPRRP